MRTPCLFACLQILHGAGAESAVAGAPAPHDDQLGVDEIGRLAPRRSCSRRCRHRSSHGEDLGLGRHVRPQIGAAAEHVEEALRRGPAVQHRLAAGARGVEDRGVAVFRRARAAIGRRPRPAPRPTRCARTRRSRAVRCGAADIAGGRDDRRARSGRRRGRTPAAAVAPAPIGADRSIYGRCGRRRMRVDDAAAAAIVAAGAGDDGLAGSRRLRGAS